jgi:hypothetical protein
MKSRRDKELERILNRGKIENLAYWKGRLRVIKRQYDRKPSPAKAEELALCDRMVRKIEFYVLRKAIS